MAITVPPLGLGEKSADLESLEFFQPIKKKSK
jgi:hypothetical protein